MDNFTPRNYNREGKIAYNYTNMPDTRNVGKRVIDINELVDVFEAQEGIIEQIIGKTGHGKTYEATRRALEFLRKGYVVYTTWHMNVPEYYDERRELGTLIWNTLFFKKRFYLFKYKENLRHLDIDKVDIVDYVAGLTDCIVMLDEGQDIFDSYEGRGMSKEKRKTLTRTRHLNKTLIIISQRAQAVAVTARANVTWFYKCVKTRAWFWPFKNYFKIYRTEEMDQNNFPIWDEPSTGFKAELWRGHFADQVVYDAFNSWYLRKGIKKSQTVAFEAYDLELFEKLVLIFRAIFKRGGNLKGRKVEDLLEEGKKQAEKFQGIKT